MPLPAQVQRDLDRANALLATQQAPQVAPPQVPAQPLQVEQVQQAAPQPPVAQHPVEDWEHKYRTLQGVHNRHTADLKTRIGELEEHIANLARAQRQQPQQVETQAPEMNPQDAETFGQDLVEMVRRNAESMAGATINQLNGRIAALEQQLAGASAVATKTADEVFYERLTQLVPDWETTNSDEGFLAWLSEVDPMYGTPRQAALTSAGNQRDVNRVAHVFRTYKGVAGETRKPASRQEPNVSPRTSGTGNAQVTQPVTGASGPLITIQAVEGFYRDVQRGLYKGREAEQAQQEAIVNAALAENRIVDARQIPRQM